MQDLIQQYVDGNKEVEQEILDSINHDDDYDVKNKGFMTSHKLMDYEECPFFAKMRHIEGVPYPMAKENDNFTMGSGVEDSVTMSEEEYDDKYTVVKTRASKEAKELKEMGQILLTTSMGKTIQECRREFHTTPFDLHGLEKRSILAPFNGYCLKAEFDSFPKDKTVPTELKSCANLNTFEKDFREGNWLFDKYIFQQAFYSFVYELREGTHYDHTELFVIDKYDWSRSQLFILGYHSMLRPQYDKIERLIGKWKESEESGVWEMPDLMTFEGRKILRDSPYYLLPQLDGLKKSQKPIVF